MSGSLDSLRAALQGRYRIERQIGAGGMAAIYLAQDERHSRQVAVKLLDTDVARTIGLERFHREIQIAARLNHPHILPLLDSGTLESEGRTVSAYYVMPYIEGESLRERLGREGKLPVDEAVRLTREVAGALDYAHRNGVIHRDIKPENILLSEGHAVVMDFGIARALDQAGAATMTQAGAAIGTPAYMSPEQVSGDPVDGRSDQFALSCTLFEMLTGRLPWTGSLQTLVAKRLAEPAPRVRTVNPEVPHAVDSAVARALTQNPVMRFATPAEFAAALETGGGPGPGLAEGRGRAVKWAVAVAGLGLGGFLLFKLFQPSSVRADAISTLAIAPLTGLESDGDAAYLSEGIQDAVADLLRQLPQLQVTAPSLVAQTRRQRPTLNDAELGAYLKVGAVLAWRIRKTGDSVAVRAELLKVPDGQFLWSAGITRPLSEIFALQESIARTIADSLRLRLSDPDRARLASGRPTLNTDAYDYYMRGRHFYSLAIAPGARSRAYLDSVLLYARRALAIDSSFGAAWALVGSYHLLNGVRGFGTFSVEVDSADRISARAIALDSAQGQAWADRNSFMMYFLDRWDEARGNLERAIRFAPTHPSSWLYYGIYLGEVEGRLDSGIAMARKAVALDPTPFTLNTLGDLFMRARSYDSAIAVLQQALAIDSTVSGPRQRLVTSYERTGRYAEAVLARRRFWDETAAPFEEALRTGGASGYERALRADRLARIDSLTRFAGGPRVYPRDSLPPIVETRIATVYGQLGDWKSAMDWIEKEYRIRPKRFRLWVTHPDMAGLRNEPRFLARVKKAGVGALLTRP